MNFEMSQLNVCLFIFSITVILFIFVGALSDIKKARFFYEVLCVPACGRHFNAAWRTWDLAF